MSQEPAKDFEKAAPPALMAPDEYYDFLKTLVTQGTGWGKTQNVGAFKLLDIICETLTKTGISETTSVVELRKDKKPVYMVMDLDQYPLERTRKQVMVDMAAHWGKRNIREEDLSSPDFRGPGIYLNKASDVEDDYLKLEADPGSSLYRPNPDAYRVCIQVPKAVNVPVTWAGGFVIEAGGTLAVRSRDVPKLVDAFQSIADGSKSIEQALYAQPNVALVDAYGMEPGFLPTKYKPLELKAETRAVISSYANKL